MLNITMTSHICSSCIHSCSDSYIINSTYHYNKLLHVYFAFKYIQLSIIKAHARNINVILIMQKAADIIISVFLLHTSRFILLLLLYPCKYFIFTNIHNTWHHHHLVFHLHKYSQNFHTYYLYYTQVFLLHNKYSQNFSHYSTQVFQLHKRSQTFLIIIYHNDIILPSHTFTRPNIIILIQLSPSQIFTKSNQL